MLSPDRIPSIRSSSPQFSSTLVPLCRTPAGTRPSQRVVSYPFDVIKTIRSSLTVRRTSIVPPATRPVKMPRWSVTTLPEEAALPDEAGRPGGSVRPEGAERSEGAACSEGAARLDEAPSPQPARALAVIDMTAINMTSARGILGIIIYLKRMRGRLIAQSTKDLWSSILFRQDPVSPVHTKFQFEGDGCASTVQIELHLRPQSACDLSPADEGASSGSG